MSSSTNSQTPSSSPRKPIVAIVGTGWAGWTIAQKLSASKHKVVVISPSRTLALTPLLASAACGLFDFRMAEEPVRRRNQEITKYQANVSSISLESRRITCTPAIGEEARDDFEVVYDQLILCPGSETNTFGTPGVLENTLQLKTVKDAQKLREDVLDSFELASLPHLSLQEKKDALHFAIVGGGPTGVELAAEISDLVTEHLATIYPHCAELFHISVYDIADKILSSFDEKLSEYAMDQFHRRGVDVCMNTEIEKITPHKIHTKDHPKGIPFGNCIWAVGNKGIPLLENLNEVKKPEKGLQRVLTDGHLRALKPSKAKPEDGKFGNDQGAWENVYVLGDAGDVEGSSLPMTAEVALQKAKWLVEFLNTGKPDVAEFKYEDKAVVAYIGNQDGVVTDSDSKDWTGASAWFAWRSGNLEWSRSWRRKTSIWVYWVLNYIDGRELARR